MLSGGDIMKHDAWQSFLSTGSVKDYLNYKKTQNKPCEEEADINGNVNQGLSNKRTDCWGE